MMDTIQNLIDKALIREPRERSGKFSPSSFGYCYRNQYWNRKDETKSNSFDKRTLRVFKAGNLFEQFVKDLIIKDDNNWIDCGKEPLEEDDILGFADLDNTIEDIIADVKSQHSTSFWHVTKQIKMGGDIRQIKYGNWLQVMYYTRQKRRKFGKLCFISKDDLCIQEYVQPLDNYWLDKLNLELTALRYLWNKNELPPAQPRCEPNKAGEYWHCTFCSWQQKCTDIENKNK